jgi:alkanesulfonate monooxygenase SsuD/methylene tetrahydromethanopterin reductase-like flavin-dependent oxidoreductase (luciferase family)
MQFGILLSDVPSSTSPREQLRDLFRITEAAQRNGFRYICIGQHFLYGDLRWLQPVPLLARLAAEVDPDVRLVTTVIIAPLYHPVVLAEEVATLDIVTEGRLIFGVGLGYRSDEFDQLGVPYRQRAARLDESIALMKELWTKAEVTFQGHFWQLKDVHPHIQPYQTPHPPLWVGGHSDRGARRAGRFGDAYPVPPEATEQQMASRFAIVREEFSHRGKSFGPQPVRRNVLVGKDHDDALREFARVAQGRYVAYAQRGLDLYTEDQLRDDFLAATASHAVVGSADEVIDGLRGLVSRLPIDPLILKPQWPTMTGDEAVATLDTLGTTVVAALRDHPPLPDLIGPIS